MLANEQYKIIILTAIGSTLEFYDFTIYALFAPYLSYHFFSNTNPLVALMNTFGIFAVGYFARPLGAIVFGHIGDKWGRKYAFTLAIFLMATSTLLIGCLPSYESVGITAPLLLTMLRIIQGFSVAGEISGAAIFTLEHVSIMNRGFAVGIIFMFLTLGNTLGASVGLILTSILDSNMMIFWGWRIPFILGFILGVISFIIRIKTIETPVFMAMVREKKLHSIPILKLIRSSRKNLLAGILLASTPAATVSFLLYLPTYLSNVFHLKISSAYFFNCISFFVFAIMTAFFGWLSDSVGRREIMVTGTALSIPLMYLLFCGLSVYGGSFIWIFALGLASLAAMLNGCYIVSIAESFSPSLRYSGLAICHSISLAIFGGLAPLGFTYLINMCMDVKAPYYYLLCCLVFSLFSALHYSKKEYNTPRSDQEVSPNCNLL